MKYVINIVETVAILSFAPFFYGYGLLRFTAAAVLLLATRLLNVWVD